MDHSSISLTDPSPRSVFAAAPHQIPEAGDVGVVMARAGVGKTACLVQLALDSLVENGQVLHLDLDGEGLEGIQSWYDTLLDDRIGFVGVQDSDEVRAVVAKGRMITTIAAEALTADKLDKTLALYQEHMAFCPDIIVVDGFDWTRPMVKTAAILGSLKAVAERTGAVLWLSAQTHREAPAPAAGELPNPCQDYADLIDVGLALEPRGDHVVLSLVKTRDGVVADHGGIALQSDTMRVVREGAERARVALPSSVCTLLSGGARGAEEEFGKCAERFGVAETNYSFEGRPVARQRGVHMLSDSELAQGDVSERYLQEHMRRSYPQTPLFKKVLQSIWHQVNTANQVFVVGLIKEDGTVKGGTGWAAELGKHLGKSLHVYDQEKRSWFRWQGSRWEQEDQPRITARRFTGTGTRLLSDDGRAAIGELYERSFGQH